MSGEKHVVYCRDFESEGEQRFLLFNSVESVRRPFPVSILPESKCNSVSEPHLVNIDEVSWRILQDKTKSGTPYIEGYPSDRSNTSKNSGDSAELSVVKCNSGKKYRVWFLNYKDTNEGTEGSLLFRRRKDALRVLNDKDFQSKSEIDFIGKPGMTQIHCINRQLLSRHRFIEGCNNSYLTPMQIRGAN